MRQNKAEALFPLRFELKKKIYVLCGAKNKNRGMKVCLHVRVCHNSLRRLKHYGYIEVRSKYVIRDGAKGTIKLIKNEIIFFVTRVSPLYTLLSKVLYCKMIH